VVADLAKAERIAGSPESLPDGPPLWAATPPVLVTRETRAVFEPLGELTRRLVPVDEFAVYLRQGSGQPLCLAYHSGGQTTTDLPSVFSPSNVETNTSPADLVVGLRTSHSEGSRADVPLRVPAENARNDEALELVGMLSVRTHQPGAYDDEFVRILQWLADQAAEALLRQGGLVLPLSSPARPQVRQPQRRNPETAAAKAFAGVLRVIAQEIRTLRPALCDEDAALAQAIAMVRAAVALPGTESEGATNALPLSEPLTLREQQVWRLLAAGDSYADIAACLRVSPATVKYHCGKLYRKLGVTGRHQATRVGGLLATQRGRQDQAC